MNTVEPIRDKSKIEDLKKILRGNLRNYLLFVLGINTGLRVSDLLKLRIFDVVTESGKIRECIVIREKKTGKEKKFPVNKAARKALEEYLKQLRNWDAGDYLFPSRKGSNSPLGRTQAWKILNGAARSVGINEPIGTHTLRKTFGFHAYKLGIDIALLQKILNHSSPGTTLAYIGITQDDIDQVYVGLNL